MPCEVAEILCKITKIEQAVDGDKVLTNATLESNDDHISGFAYVSFKDERFLIDLKIGATLKLRLEHWATTEEEIAASKSSTVPINA
jgi:hypothetical protein